ncbi:hypothetical protein ACFW9L_40070 [Streptomyces sp. NPDC059517]|uniref:hypothetical protein n=1 Tax=Streptomyces sp. NPDC059517 TaxID=3346855 RepID=UPI0036B96274
MRISAAQRTENENRIRAAMDRLLRGEIPPGGWALMGDAVAADRSIVRAHALYAKGPADADPSWLDFYAPGELAGLECLARADLGQHARAASGAEQAVLLHGDTFRRNRALYTADVAIQ